MVNHKIELDISNCPECRKGNLYKEALCKKCYILYLEQQNHIDCEGCKDKGTKSCRYPCSECEVGLLKLNWRSNLREESDENALIQEVLKLKEKASKNFEKPETIEKLIYELRDIIIVDEDIYQSIASILTLCEFFYKNSNI